MRAEDKCGTGSPAHQALLNSCQIALTRSPAVPPAQPPAHCEHVHTLNIYEINRNRHMTFINTYFNACTVLTHIASCKQLALYIHRVYKRVGQDNIKPHYYYNGSYVSVGYSEKKNIVIIFYLSFCSISVV